MLRDQMCICNKKNENIIMSKHDDGENTIICRPRTLSTISLHHITEDIRKDRNLI